MASKSQPQSPGNFTPNSVSSNLIQLLDNEFMKFKNHVKQRNNVTSMDVALPLHIISLFRKLFKVWCHVPELSSVIQQEFFSDVYDELKIYFDDFVTIDHDSDSNEAYSSLDAIDELLQFVDSPEKLFQNERLRRFLIGYEWVSTNEEIVFCNICNAKCDGIVYLLHHMVSFLHLRFYRILKENESCVLADLKINHYKCEICDAKFSTLHSLIKHLSKKQHEQNMKNQNGQTEKNSTKIENNQKFVVTTGSGKFCQICNKDLLNNPDHVNSADHSKNITIFETNQDFAQLSTNGDKFHCMPCGISFSNLNKLVEHFGKEQHKVVLSLTASSASPKPLSKPEAKRKISIENIQLRTIDKKFLIDTTNAVKCNLCGVEINVIAEIIAHVDDKSHLQNVHDFNKYESYVKLPPSNSNLYSCTKCSHTCNNFIAILKHCKKSHIERVVKNSSIDSSIKNPPTETPKKSSVQKIAPKPKTEKFCLKKSDEKFVKTLGKSSKCQLCEKDLPTEAAVMSHTNSSNHMKNSEVYTKNEPFLRLPTKNCSVYRCTLCEYEDGALSSLLKHFKNESHCKAIAECKTPKPQEIVHIPAHAKSKNNQIFAPKTCERKQEKSSICKPDKKTNDKHNKRIPKKCVSDIAISIIREVEEAKQHENVSGKNEELSVSFAMSKPDNSYVIAKNDVFYCRLCDVDLHATVVAGHMDGATHRINEEVLKTCESFAKIESSIQCTVCAMVFDNMHEMVKHFKEKRHIKSGIATNGNVSEGIFGASAIVTEVCDNKDKNTAPKRIKIEKCDRKHIFRLNDTVRCNLCGVKFSDDSTLEMHLSNLNHKRNSKIYQDNEAHIKQLESVYNFECARCTFSGTLDKVIKHCKKKPHSKVKECEPSTEEDDTLSSNGKIVDYEISEFDRKCIVMKNGIIRCNLCHSKLPRVSTVIAHMSGSGHQQLYALYTDNEACIEQFDDTGYSYRCRSCDLIFTRLDTMMKHFMEEYHLAMKTEKPLNTETSPSKGNAVVNIATCDFECILCSIKFTGFAEFSKHCYSKQHKILKSAIQPVAKAIPYNVAVTDYQYHCNVCNVRLHNRESMKKHCDTGTHMKMEKFLKSGADGIESSGAVIEIVGYEYLCNLCWLPMYSDAELEEHEKTKMHKMGKNFDEVWKCNENHLELNHNFTKVKCTLCDELFGIEKLLRHCSSRDHRMKFIAEQVEEYTETEHIVWKNATQYCNLCDCLLINDHNLINHINSDKHRSKVIGN